MRVFVMAALVACGPKAVAPEGAAPAVVAAPDPTPEPLWEDGGGGCPGTSERIAIRYVVPVEGGRVQWDDNALRTVRYIADLVAMGGRLEDPPVNAEVDRGSRIWHVVVHGMHAVSSERHLADSLAAAADVRDHLVGWGVPAQRLSLSARSYRPDDEPPPPPRVVFDVVGQVEAWEPMPSAPGTPGWDEDGRVVRFEGVGDDGIPGPLRDLVGAWDTRHLVIAAPDDDGRGLDAEAQRVWRRLVDAGVSPQDVSFATWPGTSWTAPVAYVAARWGDWEVAPEEGAPKEPFRHPATGVETAPFAAR